MHGEPVATNPSSETTRVRPARARAYRYVLLTLALWLTAGLTSLGAPALAAAAECPNAAFRTGPSAALPDCRAYELVTPPVKNAGLATLKSHGADGSSAMLIVEDSAVAGLEGFPDVTLTGPESYYSIKRTASGWTIVPDDPPAPEYTSAGFALSPDYAGVSEDGLTTTWMERGVWQPENGFALFERRPDRSIVEIGPALPPTTPLGLTPAMLHRLYNVEPVSSANGGSHFFFTIGQDFWPGDETEPGLNSLYEYVGTGNTTPLRVAIDNEGKSLGNCGETLQGTSADESTVLFSVRAPGTRAGETPCLGSAPPVAELFARIDNGLADAHTVAISEPSKEDCTTCDTEERILRESRFQGVSEDGSKVFFTTTQPLLGEDTSENLYEYDFDASAGERVVRISGGDSTVSNPTANVLSGGLGGVESGVHVSEDGSHVYFVAGGVLTKTPNGRGESPEAGADNLYLFERDAAYRAGRIVFVARLSPGDVAAAMAFDVTPDGRFLVFTSERDLTPDDTSTARQVFEYDAQTGALVRVSIGQDGFADNGNASTQGARIPATGGIGYGYRRTGYEAGYWSASAVSADGSYVLFESTAGLTPQAFNEKAIGNKYANNVYEYHDGRVSLISDGQDITPQVYLIGTDASGADVFFYTTDRLAGQDTDQNVDVYDARIDGGFPAPAVSPACSGDACQGALSAAPTLLSPGSEFQAGGNPPLAAPVPAVFKPKVKPKAKPKRCKRGLTLEHGRCVRPKAKRSSYKRGARS